jgi:DNA repair photolyase
MNYWELRSKVKDLVPRMTKLSGGENEGHRLKEKGRKSNYNQFSISTGQLEKMERLLNRDEINSFAEVSLRAQSCPMPFNIDVWDGLRCPYRCRYCFADYFRHSLYTSFFDNSKEMGLRHASPDKYIPELETLMKHRGEKISGDNEVINAIRAETPMRLGIRFEDFPPVESKYGISLRLLQYLQQQKYPVMINTKSALPSRDEYLQALADNPAGAAVHFTLISSNEMFLKIMEPGAPSFNLRIKAAEKLSQAGIRVVARIEPWMMFLNDEKNQTDDYICALRSAGIEHMTFDSYSYSANSRGLAQNFYSVGYDFDRMFLLSSDSQWLSSYMLGKFIEYFRDAGLKCSTFDQGNVPDNDDWICCAVSDHFTNSGWNWGCGVIAIRYIQERGTEPTRWSDFVRFVENKGGFWSERLKQEVHLLWNCQGDQAWPIFWGRGIEPIGNDEDGTVWRFEKEYDFRKQLMEEML